MDEPIRYFLQLDAPSEPMPVREVRGREAMSETSRFEVALTLPEGVEVVPKAVVKSRARLKLVSRVEHRTITGIITEVFVSRSVSGRPELELVIEPRLSLARHRTNLKIFRNKSAVDIAGEVLSELGIAYELRLADSYPVRPYTVQLRESDLHFVSRMLEEEGIHYFFTDDDVLVLGDSTGGYDPLGSYPCRHPAGEDQHDETLWDMGHFGQADISQVSLRDWWIETPGLGMDVSAAGPTACGPELYDYPGEYRTPSEGRRIASLMAEAHACRAGGVAGSASVGALAPGRTVTVDEAPDDSLLGSFVITRVEHDFHREREGFSLAFRGLPASRVLRPMRVHEAPVLTNPLIGVVTGPPGADIHTDELGRVKVHFPYDRLLPFDDDCSDWVPVMQDNTAHSVAIPRVGWEVLVHFLEGDPDRPVVLGRLYNGEDLIPLQLPENRMITALTSLSSPTRDGTNEILFDDRAGMQKIAVLAEKDQNIVIANDRNERVQFNETSTVGHDEVVAIGHDTVERMGNDFSRLVEHDQTVSIGGNATTTVGSNGISEDVEQNRALSIGGSHRRRIGKSDSADADTLREQVGALVLETSLSGNTMDAGKVMAVTVGGAVIEAARMDKNDTAAKARIETIGGVAFDKAKGELKIQSGSRRMTNVGGMLKVTAKESLTLTARDSVRLTSLTQKHSGDGELNVKVAGTSIALSDGLVSLYAPETISLEIENDNLLGSAESSQNSGDSGAP